MSATSSVRSLSIEINTSALVANYALAKQRHGGKAFAVIKADAYGHGAVNVAKALPDADAFAVVTMGEAEELRTAGITQPILVLQGPQTAEHWLCLETLDVWPVLHTLEQVEQARSLHATHSNSQCPRYWLKVDTGMGRLGMLPEQATELLRQHARDVQQKGSTAGALWRGVLTHFASADDPDSDYTQHQISQFRQLPVTPDLELSLANSAAVLAWPAARADWARPGLMLYGASPLPSDLPDCRRLQPAMRVTAPLISVRRMHAGSSIGYSQTFHAPANMLVGWVAAGYADGVPRILDENATVSVQGKPCRILGRVSMDSIAIDLSAVPEAQIGMRAELWGPGQSVDVLSAAAGTISYELLTRVQGVRRYVSDWQT